jgi:sigma-54 dependent transcriptional regulator, acetoin dehydrogenase operon transcriptional activator AcoR
MHPMPVGSAAPSHDRLALIAQARRAMLDAHDPDAGPRLSPWVANS